MINQVQATLPGRTGPASYRTTARIVGALFLAGMTVYITGNALIQSIVASPDYLATIPANSMTVAVGAVLMLMAGIFDAAHGILMFPILRQRHERIAVGYLGYRIVDAVLIAVGVMFVLLLIPLGREYLQAGAADGSSIPALSTLSVQAHLFAYEIGMTFVGIAGLMLCFGLYQARLVPRPVAVWGLVGYASLLGGSALTVLGFDLLLIHTIPGGLWELFIGVWLITKGFNSTGTASGTAVTEIRRDDAATVPAA